MSSDTAVYWWYTDDTLVPASDSSSLAAPPPCANLPQARFEGGSYPVEGGATL